MSVTPYTPGPSKIVHESRVDFRQRVIQSMIHIVQYDKSLPIIAVELYSNGQKWTLPSDANVKVRWGKRDHTYVYLDVLGCNAERTVVYFEIVEQMTVFYGEHNPVLEVIIGDSVACSSYIPFYIDRNPIQRNDIESEAVPSVVEMLEAEIRLKQDILVSGTNIKTINGQSILGSGNLVVSIDLSGYYTKTETDTLLAAKADSSSLNSYYTKTQTDNLLAAKADSSALASYYTKTQTDTLLTAKQPTLVSGTNIKTINGQTLLGSGDMIVSTDLSGYYTKAETDELLSGKADSSSLNSYYTKTQTDTLLTAKVDSSDLASYYTKTETDDLLGAKQATLVSGTNIKTINSSSLLGSGNITIDKTSIGLGNVDNTSDLNKPISSATQTALNSKQAALVSGTNIKTINGESILGSGNIIISTDLSNYYTKSETNALLDDKQVVLVSGTNIKTINGQSILGSGNITISTDLSNYYTKFQIDTFLSAKQPTLVSGTNIKTINNQSILGSGNLNISSGMQNPMTTAGDIIIGGTSGAPSRLAKGSNHQLLGINSSGNVGYLNGIPYITTAPSSANTDGDLKFVVLTEEPATRYDGYIYIIASQTSGYSGSILSYADSSFNGGTYIKFDTPPTSSNDYDSYTLYNDATVHGSTSYSNKTKIYVWNGYVKINNVVTSGGIEYSSAVEITLDGNYDINLAYGYLPS